MPEIIRGIKSTCHNAPLYGELMTPIDTGLTLVCSVCGDRDKKAEKRLKKILEMKRLSNEALVKKIIVNSVKATQSGIVVITSDDTLAFDYHHPAIEIAKELEEAKNEILRRLEKEINKKI